MAFYVERQEKVEAFRFGMEPPPYWFIVKHNACEIVPIAPAPASEPQKGRKYRPTGKNVMATIGMVSPEQDIETIAINVKCGEGTWRADYGDYIVRRSNGSIVVMKPAQFIEAYQEA